MPYSKNCNFSRDNRFEKKLQFKKHEGLSSLVLNSRNSIIAWVCNARKKTLNRCPLASRMSAIRRQSFFGGLSGSQQAFFKARQRFWSIFIRNLVRPPLFFFSFYSVHRSGSRPRRYFRPKNRDGYTVEVDGCLKWLV